MIKEYRDEIYADNASDAMRKGGITMIKKLKRPVKIGGTTFREKINELVDAVNGILDYAPLEMAMKAEPEPAENVRLPYMQNKRLRKALGIAQSALIKLANDAYDFDEHIYIDKILNQIERITKGGDNE